MRFIILSIILIIVASIMIHDATYIPKTDEQIYKWCKAKRPFFNSSVYCGTNPCMINERSKKLGKIVQDYCFGKFFNKKNWYETHDIMEAGE